MWYGTSLFDESINYTGHYVHIMYMNHENKNTCHETHT